MSACDCGGSRFKLGGWMGPTALAPYPKPCGCFVDPTPRRVQVAWWEYVLGRGFYNQTGVARYLRVSPAAAAELSASALP